MASITEVCRDIVSAAILGDNDLWSHAAESLVDAAGDDPAVWCSLVLELAAATAMAVAAAAKHAELDPIDVYRSICDVADAVATAVQAEPT